MESANLSDQSLSNLDAIPYLNIDDNTTISKMVKQHNYNNSNLQTISLQLNRIENQIQSINEKKSSKIITEPTIVQEIPIKPPISIEGFNVSNRKDKVNKFITQLLDRMKDLKWQILSEDSHNESDIDSNIESHNSSDPDHT